MRLTLFLLLISLTQVIAVPSYSQATKINLDLKNSTVKDVLYEIESKSEFYFLFNSRLVDVDRKVDIKVTNEQIDRILDKLFKGCGVSYSVMDRQIIIQPSEMSSKTETQQQKWFRGSTCYVGEPFRVYRFIKRTNKELLRYQRAFSHSNILKSNSAGLL
jgi:hypothetical protein